jgi:hypothetical protein
MTLKEFNKLFKLNIEFAIPASDKPALRQAWNDQIDAMCKNGQLPERARDWSHPRRFYKYNTPENPNRPSKHYERKTKDEYHVHGLYAHGWEEVTAEETRKEANERLKEYRENEPGTMFKVVSKRVPRTVTA